MLLDYQIIYVDQNRLAAVKNSLFSFILQYSSVEVVEEREGVIELIMITIT